MNIEHMDRVQMERERKHNIAAKAGSEAQDVEKVALLPGSNRLEMW